jgi:peptidoglycan hydrolase CwlO-like protein
MKPIEKNEIFGHLSSFLKDKGIELKEGSYSRGIHKSCEMLADMINLSQQGMERAKTELDKKADQLRQVIHENTAPKAGSPPQPAAAPQAAKVAAESGAKKSAPRKGKKAPAARRSKPSGK